MSLDFNEISSYTKFEDLVVSYFEDLKNEKNSVTDVNVKPSGVGNDGGRDILVTLKVNDTIVSYERTWVIQCKFHNTTISTDKISDINIPSLIHSYNASGYLLICRQNPTSKLTEMFERLERNCSFDYKYMVWSGEQFKRLISVKVNHELIQQYFPKYYDKLK